MSDVIRIVHIGAGNHSVTNKSHHRHLIKQALLCDGFLESSRLLEISKWTNTGFGSSLTLEGKVECDASFIHYKSGKIRSRSIVGISVENPIAETWKLYDNLEETYSRTSSGLSCPTSLHYESAEKSIDFVDREINKHKPLEIVHLGKSTRNLVLNRARRTWELYRANIFASGILVQDSVDAISDTIGIVEIAPEDGITKISSSSGGNFFKLPGRIGCAGVVGAAIDLKNSDSYEVCCMCSGNGEDVITLLLANYVSTQILTKLETLKESKEEEELDDELDYGALLVDIIKKHTRKYELNSCKEQPEPYLGAIVSVRHRQSSRTRIVYCHSTESFYFGFINKSDGEPNIVLSRLTSIDKIGQVYSYGEFIV